MNSLKLAVAALVFATGSASANNVTDQFSIGYGEPSAQYCQSGADIGKTNFDPDSGRLWACGTDGWVYFESKASDRLACLDQTDSAANYPQWKPRQWNERSGQYYKGEIVRFNGKLYTPTNGAVSGTSNPATATWDWHQVRAKSGLPTRWESSHQYSRNNRVVHMGIEYKAREANAAKQPNDTSTNYQPWDYVGPFSCPKA